MRKKILLVLTGTMTAVLFWIQATADAEPIANLSLAELCRKSDAIVIGRCVGAKSQWRGKLIVTIADVQVSSYLKGDLGKKIQIITPGGRARKTTKNGASFPVRQSIQGAARFSKGEEVLLFLTEFGGRHFVVGMQEGKKTIVTDKASGKKFVIEQETRRQESPKSSTPIAIRRARSANVKRFSLDDYTAQIARNLAEHSGKSKVSGQSADSGKK